MGEAGREREAERFVEAFGAAWARPRLEDFAALAAPDVRLVQPVAAETEASRPSPTSSGDCWR